MLGDTEGPVYEAMQAELKRARSAAQLQPASVRLEQCRSFVERAKKRISDLEAEMRLVRLEARGGSPSPAYVDCSRFGRTSGQSPRAIAKDGGRTRCSIGRSASEAQGCVPWPGSRRASHSSHARVDSSRVDTLDGRQASGSSGCFELRRPQVNSGDHIQVGRRSIEVERDHRWHGPLIFADRRPPTSRYVRVVVHQCGFLGCRVGEASNPGPVQTRQARRLERSR